ncbi:MAG: tetratricopeptide repeat protein [Pyrinomonadaceae bacterium]
MKSNAPSSKLFLALLCLFALINTSLAETALAQKRGRAPQKSASRAAGIAEEADKLLAEGKSPEAIDAYKIAIRLDPKFAPAYRGLGDAYFNSGKWEEGLAAYKEQVRLEPNSAQAQYDLGYAYNAMGRHGEAFAPLVTATTLDPSYAEAYYGIGYAYLRGTDLEKSLSYFKGAIRLQADYADAYYGLGQAYARLGQTDAANEQVKKLASIDAKLAQKLGKEIQMAQAGAGNSASARPSAPVQTAGSTPLSQPETEKPAALVDVMRAPTQQPQPVVNRQSSTPQNFSPASTVAPPAETLSRQLEQLPAAQAPPASSTTQPVSSSASSTVSQSNQITTLPVGPKRWALVIGVDKYMDPQISPLKGSDNDARLIADALVRYAGFPQDQVILLSTAQPMERQPTRVNILRRLSNLSTAVPKDGLLLISFAGHGMERGGQAFLMPSDAQISDQISFLEETAISINRVKERIKETGVKQVLVLLDACRNDPGGRADAPNPLSNAYTNAFKSMCGIAKSRPLPRFMLPESASALMNTLKRSKAISVGR